MKFLLAVDVKFQLKKLKKKNPKLLLKVKKQLHLFEKNHKHPSLHSHKLKGKLQDTWSISIEDNIRMLYTLKKGEALFVDIGTHDKVYKK